MTNDAASFSNATKMRQASKMASCRSSIGSGPVPQMPSGFVRVKQGSSLYAFRRTSTFNLYWSLEILLSNEGMGSRDQPRAACQMDQATGRRGAPTRAGELRTILISNLAWCTSQFTDSAASFSNAAKCDQPRAPCRVDQVLFLNRTVHCDAFIKSRLASGS